MISTSDLPFWTYVLTVAIGSMLFLHRQREESRELQKQLREMEARLHARFESIEQELHPEMQPQTPPRRVFRLIRSTPPASRPQA
jgi:hypothetical protein